MTVDEAIQRTIEEFPFKGYIIPETQGKGAYSNIANVALRHLKPGSKILDIGCGPCDKTAVLQFLGFQCTAHDDLQDDWHMASDNREKILAFIKKCGIDFQQAEGSVLPLEKNSFDMLMLNDVLEHLHESPRDMLNDLLEFVKPAGLLFVTVPNAVNIRKRIDVMLGKTNLPRYESYYWYPGMWRGHIREYVRNDLAQLCKFLNLEVLELRGCDHMLQKLPRSVVPAYLLATGIFQGWKDSWMLVAQKKPDWIPQKTPPKENLAKIKGLLSQEN